MKSILSIGLCLFMAYNVNAQVRMPAPSSTQSIKQDFGLGSVELTYSRPSLKGRKIIGNIEPYGVMWRTGANAATKIRFTDPVEIMGNKVDTGSYVLYTIPEKDKDWTFILNRGVTNWGIDGYKEAQDVLRVKVKPNKQVPTVETLTMQFANVTAETMDLTIRWEDVWISVPLKTNVKDRIKGQINNSLFSAAQYYFEYEKNNQMALDMINKALDRPDKQFWVVHYKARIQKEMGDKKGAIATANESMKLAKEAKNDNYVLMNEKLIAELQ